MFLVYFSGPLSGFCRSRYDPVSSVNYFHHCREQGPRRKVVKDSSCPRLDYECGSSQGSRTSVVTGDVEDPRVRRVRRVRMVERQR